MKQLLLFFYSIILGLSAAQAAPWKEPALKWHTTSLPTDGTKFVLYNTEKQMFLTKGTRWGTHASLTSEIDNALTYTYNAQQLKCSDGNILFVTEENEANTAHVYYDYNPGSPSQNVSMTFFDVVPDGSNGLLIKMATNNHWYGKYGNSCLGWNYFNEDTDYNHNSLGTNLSLFMLDPDFYGVSVHWGYITNEEKETFQYRKRLYNLLCECYNQGTAPSEYETASNVYNKASSTLEEIKNAYKDLYYKSASYPIDLTSEIYNPRFDYNADGWSVNMPGAQNKGFQNSSYYNGVVSINHFVEAWVSKGNLGVGSILQTINGLPEGKYTMEADVIANDQNGRNNPVNGVYAVTESDVQYRTRLATGNGVPEHFTLTFYNEGAQLTIGLRTEEDCEANWIALDNVSLYYWGPVECQTTDVSINPSSEQVTEGEQVKLTASVTTNDEFFNTVKWSSSDETVAKVNANGLVTTLKPGTVTITAKAVGCSLSSQATITVMKNDVTGLVINEIQVANIDQFIDPSYNYGGWIELYNPTGRSINLGRLYVSDEKTNLKKFQMPDGSIIIKPNGYKNIWFDHNAQDGNFGGESQNNVRFKLNIEGGSIYLSESEDILIASATYPASVARCSYARTTDGGSTWGMTSTPTPEASNMGSAFATERLAAPVISRDGGVFSYATEVSFNVQIPDGATLRYTTDGSTPTLNHGNTSYDGQFSAYSTTVYRFALFKDGYLPSPVVTRSFIYKNHDYYLPVISVVTEPANLYDNMIGIYTQGTNGTAGNGKDYACNWNRDWERPVNIEYMRPDANDASSFITHINQETDMEIAGGWSRGFGEGYTDGKYWPMKSSFRIKGSKVYEGQNTLDFAVFPNKPYNKYKVWQVRNGGNDTNNRSMDPLLNRIVLESGFYVDAQDASPAHVFFNGEYLGMLNIRESNNRHYGDSNYGIDTEEMDQFDLSNAQYNQKVGDSKAWDELLDLSEQLHYTQSESVWNEICKRLDMDEYINYMALECFLNCDDWITNTNNVKGFRAKTDGKFHFVLFDTDSAFKVYNDNILSDIIYTSAGASVAKLFQNIYNYPAFQQQFIDALCIVNGSVFNPSHFEPIVTNWYNETNTAKNFEVLYGLNSSVDFINMLKGKHDGNPIWNMAYTFNLPASYHLNLSSNIPSARLSLNGQMIPTGNFNGYAYNYRNNGIHLTAKAPAGYRFTGWKQEGYFASGGLQKEFLIEAGATWYYYDQGPTATNWTNRRFQTATNGWKQGQAPFGYAGSPELYMQSTANTILDYGPDSSNKRPTYYFRKTLTLPDDPVPGETYMLHYKVDDGCRIHVNGQDVGGYHCEIGATYDTFSTTYEANDPYEDEIDITQYLTLGPNAIAVEVHNVSNNSSDIYFDAWLVKLSRAENGDIISSHETFCLSNIEGSGEYTLEACYEPIEGEVKRYEAGATPIRINEVSAGNDIHINEYAKKSDWVELYNTTDAPVDVAGMYLSDNAKKPQKWQISKTAADGTSQINTIVPAGGHLIVWCDDLAPVNQLHSGFRLSNADGACVSIQAEDGRWADCMQYLEQPRWTTYGRYPDGGNHEQLLEQPTIAKANRIGLLDYNGITEEDFLSDDITVTLAMAEGWNWVSHNMATNVDKSRFTSYANIIRGLSSELFFDDILGWQGLLNHLKPANGYKVNMTQQADITLRGDLFPSMQAVTVQKGWNWIGCPLPNATALDIALANYAATEGDVIVAQDAMATYTSGTWTGSLNTLQPGQAYMMQSGKAQSFVWKALSGNKVRQRRYLTARHEEVTPWNLDIHAYPNVMPMIARVEAHDIDLNGGYTLGVFVDDECRGVAKVEDDLLYINIHGEGGETLSFQLMDANGDVYTSSQIIEMQNLQLTGSVRNPYRISFNAKDVTPVIASQNGKEVMTNVYYSLNGQRLIQPRGICIQKTIFQDGTTLVKKVVK